ncbi:MAG: FtsX-like permease family protein [Alphaproteobacteria bacterium]|nr:MAG: FtsX-like permease family protein [Alphaproteobacteria bacterium]
MTKALQNLPLSLRFAVRELRGGVRGFKVFLACLILGVGAIAAVGTLTEAVQSSLQDQGRSLLAGDIEIRMFQREASPEEKAFFENSGEVSDVLRLRAMTRSIRTDERMLSELKAVDELYPLYGELTLAPAGSYQEIFGKRDGQWGLAADPNLAERLGVELGDLLRIGDLTFELRALIEKEPDRSNEGFLLGPTSLVARDVIPETGLILPGSLYYQHYKLKIPIETDIEAWRENLNETFPEARWRVRDRFGSAPGVRRFVERMGMFLSLVSLMTLVVGGVGVGNAVGNYMRGKTPVIATLKILGADSKIIFHTYLLQILLFSALAITIGLLAGVGAAYIVVNLIGGVLPIDVAFTPSGQSLAIAAFYGVCVSLIFSLWPLAIAKKVPPVRLIRSLVTTNKVRPDIRYRLYVIGLMALVMAMAIFLSPWQSLAAGFVGGAAAVIIMLRWAGMAVVKLATYLPRPKNPALRLAISNLHRPGAATAAVVMSLGLGLSLFTMVILVDKNFSARLTDQIPDQAPAFFMIDIQKDQVEAFRQTVEGIEGASDLRLVPSLRGRIVSLKGIPSDEVEVEPEAAWVLNGDRVITYSTEVPEGNSLSGGDWWPADYTGPPLVSFAAEEAKGLGLDVGDSITVSVLGRDITATVVNLRTFDWGTMNFNFVMVFDPGALEAAPHTFMASLKAADGTENLTHRILTDAFPNITAIRMKEILTSIDNILVQIRSAVNYTGALAIFAGILVLGGALAAGYRFRVYDSVILKILGAVRRDILSAFVFEYALLGLITGVLALVFGSISSYLVIVQAMEMEFTLFPQAAVLTVAGSLVITLLFGILNTWRALGEKPSKILREF